MTRFALLRLCLLIMLTGSIAGTHAQTNPRSEDLQAPTVDLDARRQAAEADTSLPDEVKAKVLGFYDRAAESLRKDREALTRMESLRLRAENAPELGRVLREKLDTPTSPAVPDDDEPLPELAARAQQKRGELNTARELFKAKEASLASLTALGANLGDDAASRSQALSEAEGEQGKPGLADEPAALGEARRAFLDARVSVLRTELEESRLLLANYEALVRLETLERDVAVSDVGRLDTELELLDEAVEVRREMQASAALKEAAATQAATANMPEAIAAIAEQTAKFREELQSTTRLEADVGRELRATERIATELDANRVAVQQRVDAVGPTEAIGRLLRRRLEGLPAVGGIAERSRTRQDGLVTATDRRIDIEELRRDLLDVKQRAEKIVDSIPETVVEPLGREWLLEETTDLLTDQRDTLDQLHEVYGRYLTQLTSLAAAEGGLSVTVKEVHTFIRQELLWIRSLPPLTVDDHQQVAEAAAWLFLGDHWRTLAGDIVRSASEHPNLSIGMSAVVILLLLLRPLFRHRLRFIGTQTRKIRTDAFHYTLSALVYTVLIACAGPLILTVLGWHLANEPIDAIFSTAVGDGLLVAGELTIVFSVLRWVTHPEGLAQRHFRWPESVRIWLRREVAWFGPLFVGGGFLVVTAGTAGSETLQIGLGRPGTLLVGLSMLLFIWRAFGPKSATLAEMRHRSPRKARTRLWRLWFPLLCAVPMVLIAGTITGYHYTATQLLHLMVETSWLVVGLMFVSAVLVRWYTVAERRIRFENAVRHREEARAQREQSTEQGEAEPAAIEIEETVDFRELGEQARTIIQGAVFVGMLLALFSLWADLLPALTVLDRVTLPMNRVHVINGVEELVPVTLGNLLLSIVILAVGLFTAKNLPGLLGFMFLRRVRMDPGASYAVVTLCQYAVVAAVVVYSFSSAGVQWSKLQWLVAALGVGLGFGLQEIVANFVSGIILLLERPVRVGDIVTVGGADGTVARIRIRATTIRTWDRKELVVPNKAFITSEVLNWTLSDSQTRLFFVVGVAYGSDVRLARDIILAVTQECDHVLEDPAPSVTFASFGDNALNLEVRCYLPSMDNLLATKTELNDAIYERLAEAGIGIAFPQRDVHLDTTRPLEVRMLDGDTASARPGRKRGSWRRSP